MMGLLPGDLSHVFDGLGATAGRDRRQLRRRRQRHLVSLLAMTERDAHTFLISKGNCGVPYFAGTEAVYTGTPELMGRYTAAGGQGRARGSSAAAAARRPVHLAAMRHSLDELIARPTVDDIIEAVGPLVNSAPSASAPGRERRRPRRGE